MWFFLYATHLYTIQRIRERRRCEREKLWLSPRELRFRAISLFSPSCWRNFTILTHSNIQKCARISPSPLRTEQTCENPTSPVRTFVDLGARLPPVLGGKFFVEHTGKTHMKAKMLQSPNKNSVFRRAPQPKVDSYFASAEGTSRKILGVFTS